MKDGYYEKTSGALLEEAPSPNQGVLKKGKIKNFFMGSLLSLGLLPLTLFLLKKEMARHSRDRKRFLLSREHLKEIVTVRDSTSLAHARLAAIVEYSDDAIISKDLSGRILTWNAGAYRMFGYRPGEIIGKSTRLLLPPEKTNEEEEIVQALQQGH